MPMKRRWKILIAVGAALVLLGCYPAFVLGYTWYHVAKSDLPGGRNGPLDAYRHTLASAVVAYTLDEKVVYGVSRLMEHHNAASNRMDRHNNYIGAHIGMRVQSFGEIKAEVARQVARGKAWARDRDQVTWMSEACWEGGKMW